jgi:hypothetical protein
MSRKILVALLALAGLLTVAGVAYAVNTYKLDKASTTGKGGVGTSSKPVAKKVVFSFSTNTDDGNRAKVIKDYDIGFQGLRSYSKNVKKCTFAQASQKSLAAVQSSCRKAAAGGGTVNNFFGSTNDPTAKTQCKLKLRLYNISDGKYGGLALRLDRNLPGDCLIDPQTAINAKFRKTKIGGKESVNLKFSVGDNLKHPIPGFDNSVNNVTSAVAAKTAKVKIKGKTRTVGLLSSVACGKSKKRVISVKFTDESNASKSVKKSVKC